MQYEHKIGIQANRRGKISQRKDASCVEEIWLLNGRFTNSGHGDSGTIPHPDRDLCSLSQHSGTNLLSWHQSSHSLSVPFSGKVMLCEVPPEGQESAPWNLQTCSMQDSCWGDISEAEVPRLHSWDQSFMHESYWQFSKQWDVVGWCWWVSSLQFKSIKWEMKLNQPKKVRKPKMKEVVSDFTKDICRFHNNFFISFPQHISDIERNTKIRLKWRQCALGAHSAV